MGSRYAIPILITSLSVTCTGPSPQPASVLPQDAGALVVFAPPARIRESLAPFMVRLPEAAGVVDLVRSVVGIALDDDTSTRDNGLDPYRGPALAVWDDAVLAVLPLCDKAVGLRRLRLRLARLGFVRDETGPTDPESYRSLDHADRTAVLGSAPGLAFVCIGTAKRCNAGRPGTGWDPRPVIEELAAENPVAVGVVRNPLLAGIAKGLGLSVRESGVGVALALLHDARWAVGLDQGVWLRIVAGPAGPPIAPQRHEASLAAGLAAVISIALPPGVVTAVSRHLVAWGPWDRWTGEAGAAILASEAGVSPLPADLGDVLRRARWVVALRFRVPGDAENALRALEETGGPKPEGSEAPGGTVTVAGPRGVGMASRAEHDVLLVGSEAGRPILPRVAPETLLLEQPCCKHGCDRAAKAALGKVNRHEDAQAPEVSGRGACDASLKDRGDGVTLLRVRADPGALLDAVGGGGLEYIRHMVRSVGTIGATLTFEGGRWVLTLDAGLR